MGKVALNSVEMIPLVISGRKISRKRKGDEIMENAVLRVYWKGACVLQKRLRRHVEGN